MGLTTILRGFKVPVAVLDRFFESNGVMPTFGYPPRYYRSRLPGDPPEDFATQDAHSALLRAKLAATPAGAADTHNQNIRIFIPNKEGNVMSTHAYISYAYVIVFCQRQIDVAASCPTRPCQASQSCVVRFWGSPTRTKKACYRS